MSVMNNKGLEITIQALLAIFLVIFVALVLLTALSGRTSSLQTRSQFDSYRQVNTFLVSLLSNPACINIGTEPLENRQVAVAGILSAQRLNALDAINADLWCIRPGNFIYEVSVSDEENRKSWQLGVTAPSTWSQNQVSVSLPVAIRYSEQIVHSGRATINAYLGPEADIYSSVRQACFDKERLTLKTSVAYTISYDGDKYCIGRSCFRAAFVGCIVRHFTIKPGTELVLISMGANNTVVVSS